MSNNKRLSVALSAIMVLSMVAMGTAVFAGSAAAQNFDGDIDDASIVAVNATADNDPNSNPADHILEIDVGDGDIDGDLDNITIQYSEDVDLTEVDETNNLAGGSNDDINVFVGATESTADTGSGGDGITVDDNEIVIDGLSDDAQDPNDDTVTVHIHGIGNPSTTDTDVTAIVKDDDVGEGTVTELELAIGEDAPIEVTDSAGDPAGDYGLLELDDDPGNINVGEDATDALEAEGTISISDVVDNEDVTNTLVGGNDLIREDLDDITVTGTEDEAEVIYGDNTGNVFVTEDSTDDDGVEISDIEFNATGDDVAAIDTNSGDEDAINLTVTGNEFSEVDETAIDVAVDDEGADPSTNVIDDNVVDSTSSDAINVDASELDSVDDSVSVSENDVTATGSSGINIAGLGEDVLTFEANDVESDESNTGVHITGTGDNVTIEDGTIEDVDVGVDISDSAEDFVEIDGTTFDNVDTTAIDVNDGTADDVFVTHVTVENSETATAVVDDEGNIDLEVEDGQFGVDGESGVEDGVDVGAAFDATIEGTEFNLSNQGGTAIEADGSYDPTLTVANVTITDDDSSATTGVHVNLDDGTPDISIDEQTNQESDISDVDVGIDIEDVDGDNLNDITNTTITDVGSTGIHIQEDVDIDLGSVDTDTDGADGIQISAGSETVTVTNADIEVDGDAAGVKASTADDLTIEDSTVTVADDADSIGIHLDTTMSSADILENTIEAEDESSDGSAVVVDGSASATIEFNDILGFTGDDGYGLAGGDVTSVDATGNWWGSDFGPNHDDASNVDVAADTTDADVYDPFLTVEIDELEELDAGEVQRFAHDLQAGHADTLAFPGTSDRLLEDATTGFDGIVYEWNANLQQWEQVEGDDRPEGTDAYALAYEDQSDDDTLFAVEYASETENELVALGEHDYSSGWNLVPSSTEDDSLTSGDGSEVNEIYTFNLGSTSGDSIGTQFGEPAYQIYGTENINLQDTSDIATPSVSPFTGYWVYAESTTAGHSNPANIDPEVTLEDIKDQLEEDGQ